MKLKKEKKKRAGSSTSGLSKTESTVTNDGGQTDTKEMLALRQCKTAFDAIDANHNGFISVNAIQNVLKLMGSNISMKECRAFINEVDTDRSGDISFAEFEKLVELEGERLGIVDAATVKTLRGRHSSLTEMNWGGSNRNVDSVVEVQTSLRVPRVFSIDETEECFKVRLTITQEWPDLDSPAKSAGRDGPSWSPETEVFGVIGSPDVCSDTTYPRNDLYRGPVWRRVKVLVADISQRMAFKEFPFDISELLIILQLTHPVTNVVMKPFLDEKLPLVDMTACNMVLAEHSPHKPLPYSWEIGRSKCRGVKCSAVWITINLERKYQFYQHNVMWILWVITTCELGIWAIPFDDTADRIGSTLSIMFTAIAFKFIVEDKLPSVPYQTLMDQFMNMCFLFIFLAFGWHCFQTFIPDDIMESTEHHDSMALAAFSTTWAVMNLMQYLRASRIIAERHDEIMLQAESGGHLGKIQVFEKGQHIRITKKGSQTGKTGVVLKPTWGRGFVLIRKTEDSTLRTYMPHHLALDN